MNHKPLNFTPTPDKIIVKQHEAINPSETIILNKATQELQDRGTIIAIGRCDKYTHSMKVGDTVIFGSYSGQKLVWEGNTYLVMQLPDIIGFIDDDTTFKKETK